MFHIHGCQMISDMLMIRPISMHPFIIQSNFELSIGAHERKNINQIKQYHTQTLQIQGELDTTNETFRYRFVIYLKVN